MERDAKTGKLGVGKTRGVGVGGGRERERCSGGTPGDAVRMGESVGEGVEEGRGGGREGSGRERSMGSECINQAGYGKARWSGGRECVWKVGGGGEDGG